MRRRVLAELPGGDRRVARRRRWNKRPTQLRWSSGSDAVTALLDEMLSGAIADGLRVRGIDAVAVEDDALAATPDEGLLTQAATQERVLGRSHRGATSPRSPTIGVRRAGCTGSST